MVPVPQIMEAALEVVQASQECVQNRAPEQIVDVPVPPVFGGRGGLRSTRVRAESYSGADRGCPCASAVEVVRATPQECVLNRTPEQLVDEPVPQIAEEIVEGPVPLERIPVPSQRELHEMRPYAGSMSSTLLRRMRRSRRTT